MRKVLLLIAAALIFCYDCFGQEKDSILYELVKLGENVNTRYHEAAPIISPDGNTLYFIVSDHPENNYGREHSQDIWYSQRDSTGNWKEAVHMSKPFNTHRYNQIMSVFNGGNSLLLKGGSGKHDGGFSVSHRRGNEWTKPEEIDVKDYKNMNQGLFSGAAMSPDGKVLVLYFNERSKNKYSDLYVSYNEGNDKWSKPVKIGDPINTVRDEFGPFIAADNETMYFATNRWGGLGSMDIYKTRRLDDTWLKWSEPENVGPPLNTSGFDAYFSIDATGQNAFTSRAFMSPDGGSLDILGLIPKPKVYLSGHVKNKKTGEPLKLDVTYFADNQEGNNIFTTDKEGFYEILITERGDYKFNGYLEGFVELNDSLDLTQIEGEQRMTKDFLMVPKRAELFLYGRVKNVETEDPLAVDVHYGKESEKIGTIRSNADNGYYSVQLPDEGKYILSVNAAGYKKLKESIVVETELSYEEFEKNLLLEPLITLKGYVYNQKNNEPLSIDFKFEAADGDTTKNVHSNEDGYYTVGVPKKGKYYFKASTEGFLNLTDSAELAYDPYGNTKDLYLLPIEVGVTVRLNNIFFDFDKTTLRSESFPELDRVVELLNQNPTIAIEIAGHTDNQGSDEYNEKLSQGRAEEVRNYLISQGIDDDRVVAKGYGESRPEATNQTEEGRQVNRRVEFTVLNNDFQEQ